jgi:hypothetical protein
MSAKLRTLATIVGPGLILMVGDNDAGAFSTYTQAGQNYGTRLLWTLLLLVPVLYVNQEMVLRLGAVAGVGHARLILERFGTFWGAFSVIDLPVNSALGAFASCCSEASTSSTRRACWSWPGQLMTDGGTAACARQGTTRSRPTAWCSSSRVASRWC